MKKSKTLVKPGHKSRNHSIERTKNWEGEREREYYHDDPWTERVICDVYLEMLPHLLHGRTKLFSKTFTTKKHNP